MKASGLISLFLVVCGLAACGSGGGDSPAAATGNPGNAGGGAVTGEPAELAGIVQAHNDVRRAIQTSPALADLQWDDGLAATARAWAALCRDIDAPTGLIDHNPGRGNNVGENIFGSTGTATGPQAVTAWAGEVAQYTYATNTCTGVCGHYTQIVWRATTRVGCALNTCAGLQFRSSLVCNYSPAGNFVGQRPY